MPTHDWNDHRRHPVTGAIVNADLEAKRSPFALMGPMILTGALSGGAVLGALILAGVLSGCATFGKCGADGCADDAQITRNVEAELHKHPELEGVDRIHVQTRNHVVYLTGRVSEGLQARQAESAARETKGVTHVENSIVIEK